MAPYTGAKAWVDGPDGKTPILASDLLRIENGISSATVHAERADTESAALKKQVEGLESAVKALRAQLAEAGDPPMVGTVVPFAGVNKNQLDPDGKWLFCNGSWVPTSAYPELYNCIGQRYRGTAAAQAGKFRLPDLTSRVPRGAANDNVLGNYVGQDNVTLGVAHMPAHTHDLYSDRDTSWQSGVGVYQTDAGGGGRWSLPAAWDGSAPLLKTRSAGSGAAFSIIPSAVQVHFVIRAKP